MGNIELTGKNRRTI